MRTVLPLLCTLLLLPLAGCGGEEKKKTEGQSSEAKENSAAEPAKPDPAARAKLEQARDDARAKLKVLKQELAELEAQHAEERKKLPSVAELRDMRRKFSQLRKDAMQSAAKLAQMERRLKATEKSAAGATTDTLKQLQEEKKAIEKRRDTALGSYRAALDEARLGAVDESPVKKDLDTCRSVKLKWFDITPDARRGNAAGAKDRINSTFREWLAAEPKRTEICTKVLSQPGAPKGKTPKNYDFSDLEFFLLLELYENELDKLNVAVEKKEAKEKEGAYYKIKSELDAVDEKIAQAMQKAGPEYEEYLDLKGRITTVRNIDTRIQDELAGAREITQQVRELRERQAKEADELHAQVEKAKRELRAAERRLR